MFLKNAKKWPKWVFSFESARFSDLCGRPFKIWSVSGRLIDYPGEFAQMRESLRIMVLAEA